MDKSGVLLAVTAEDTSGDHCAEGEGGSIMRRRQRHLPPEWRPRAPNSIDRGGSSRIFQELGPAGPA
jgi:hypothetical protein